MALPRTCQLPVLQALESRRLFTTYFVATNGSNSDPGTMTKPFLTIEHALDVAANPGDTVEVRAGTYHEMLTLPHSGSAAGGDITLEAYPGEHVVLSGAGAASDDVGYGNVMVQIIDQSYVKVSGFEIADDSGVGVGDDAFGVRVQGAGTNVVISHDVIHAITGEVLSDSGGDVTGYGGAGIQVYGSSMTKPYANVIIDDNSIYGCEPGDDETETVTVDGNVTGFQITHNLVHDDNNIGIDMIGGEADVFGEPAGTRNLPVARDGICTHNRVYGIHANYGGGFAGGIYVDGGEDIAVADNVSSENDMGLEVGAENRGYRASGVVVENNILCDNTQAGLVLGGYQANVGRVENCTFVNNTVYGNDTQNTGSGQLLIQYASSNVITNNIFDAGSSDWIIGSDGAGNVGNVLDYNLYFASGTSDSEFDWNAASYFSFAAYQAGTGEDRDSIFANPKFEDAGLSDFLLEHVSPALGAGSRASGQYAAENFAGVFRTLPPDIGAY
jgi:hypothetical protein